MRLITKLLILTVGSVMLLGMLMTGMIESLIAEHVSQELDEWGTDVAVNLADTTDVPLLTENTMKTHHLLETATDTFSDVRYAFVTGPDGAVLADTFAGGFPHDLLSVNNLPPGSASSQKSIETEDGTMRDIAVPIQDGRVGVLHVGIGEETLYREITGMRNQMILVVLLISALGALAIIYAGNIFTRPLKSLSSAAQRIGNGELDVHVPVNSGDEIGSLSKTFNDMASELKDKVGVIEKARKEYETLVGNIPDVVYSMSADGSGQPLFISPKWSELTGYDVDYNPQVWFTPLHPDDREAARTRIRQAIAEGKEYSIEFRVIHGKTGDLRYVINHGIPTHDSEGKLICFDGIFSDVTERRLVEKQLLQSQKMESIGQLAGGVAHDLNNFMMAIQGYTELAMGKIPRGSDEYNDLVEARKSMDRATELTRQLLLFGRRTEVELRPTDINSVVSEFTAMLPRLVGENYNLVCELSDRPMVANCDPGLVEQVIMNLVINARDAMPDGGQILLKTSVTSQGDYVCLSVEDNGCGMKESIIQHVFDPFFTTKPVGQGTGLGLSLVYSIVEQLDGRVEVDSTPDHGSRFSIYFPLMNLPEKKQAVKKPSINSEAGHGEKILVIEDEQAVRSLVEKVLSNNGYSVISAASASEARKVFGKEKDAIRLIMSDIVLPDLNGVELVEELTAARDGIAVLLCSGYTADHINRQEMDARGYRFLQKPYDIDTLLKEIEAILVSAVELPDDHPGI